MKPKLRRQLTGIFHAQDLGAGSWLLARHEDEDGHALAGAGARPVMEVFLRGAEPAAAQVLRAAALSDVVIDWLDGVVELTLTSGGGQHGLQMRSAIIHEPVPQLYDALPLAAFDEGAQRFWRRIFRLVRIPGGRHLLKVLARRARNAG